MTIAALFRRWGLLALGLALSVAGMVVASQPFSFGWFGYADGGTFMQFSPDLVVMSPVAAVLLLAGVAAIAGWAGFRLGRRARHANTDSCPDA